MPKEIAECRELPAVATVLPTLRLGLWCHHSDLATRIMGAGTHGWRNLIHSHIRICDHLSAVLRVRGNQVAR